MSTSLLFFEETVSSSFIFFLILHPPLSVWPGSSVCFSPHRELICPSISLFMDISCVKSPWQLVVSWTLFLHFVLWIVAISVIIGYTVYAVHRQFLLPWGFGGNVVRFIKMSLESGHLWNRRRKKRKCICMCSWHLLYLWMRPLYEDPPSLPAPWTKTISYYFLDVVSGKSRLKSVDPRVKKPRLAQTAVQNHQPSRVKPVTKAFTALTSAG